MLPPTARLVTLTLLATFGLALLMPVPGPADDQDNARAAVARGELRPLSEILARVERDFGGRVLEVELERHQGALVYEIEVLTDNGRVLEVLYDGATGRQLRVMGEDDDDDGDD